MVTGERGWIVRQGERRRRNQVRRKRLPQFLEDPESARLLRRPAAANPGGYRSSFDRFLVLPSRPSRGASQNVPGRRLYPAASGGGSVILAADRNAARRRFKRDTPPRASGGADQPRFLEPKSSLPLHDSE